MSLSRFAIMQSESPLQLMSANAELTIDEGAAGSWQSLSGLGQDNDAATDFVARPAAMTAVQVDEATLSPTGLVTGTATGAGFAGPSSNIGDVRLSETAVASAGGTLNFTLETLGLNMRELAIDGIGPLRWDDGFLGFAQTQAQLTKLPVALRAGQSVDRADNAASIFPAEPRREDFLSEPSRSAGADAAFTAAVIEWKAQVRAINEAIGLRDMERGTVPTDPQIANLWHLNNTGQTLTGPSYGPGNPDQFNFGTQTNTISGFDANVLQVLEDYNGQGVVVAVFDDGVQYSHIDLTGSYDPIRHLSNLFNGIQNENDPIVRLDNFGQNDSHGTAVAGLIAGDANGIGIIGVAPGATLVGVDLPFATETSPVGANNAPLGQSFTAAGLQFANFDVSNNSWGNRGAFLFTEARDPFFFTGLTVSAQTGRGGLGSVIVKSAGNNRLDLVDSNTESFNASRFAIAVAALAADGFVANYSSYGSNILISGHSAGFGPNTLNYGVLTTDRTGLNGYNTTDYAQFNGTSAAAPVVSGVVALMLDANPNLSARDVAQILAYSARLAGSPVDTDTITGNGESSFATEGAFRTRFNGAQNWNGGGLHYSNNYGFGQVDARAAVRLAENWNTVGTWNNELQVTQTITPNAAIPDNNTPISFNFTLAAGISIESVRLTLGLTHAFASDLVITLTSPSGTVSEILTRPFPNGGFNAFPSGYSLSSQQFRGEESAGTWTLTFRDVFATDAGFLASATLTAFGAASPTNDRYVFTDAYGVYSAGAGRNTLEDTDGGNDTLDASALSANATIRLTAGSVSQIAGQNLTVVAGAVIENAFGGDGNDSIEGTSGDNELRGGRGNDTLNGGAGNDRLSGGAGQDFFVLSASATGNDTITDYNLLEDSFVLNGSVITSISALVDADLDGQVDDTRVVHTGGTVTLLNTAFVAFSLAGTTSGNDTINGTSNTDIILGSSGNDNLDGGGGDDALDGGTGNDFLSGGDGNDTLFGGSGDDSIFAASGRDLIDGGAGNDIIHVSSLFGAANPRILEGGDGVDTIMTTGDGVTLTDGFDGQFQGFEAIQGDSRINGGAGGQRLDIQTLASVGSGVVTLDGGAGNDTLIGGAGRELLVGGTDRDVLMGYGGNDTLQGGDGADWLFGGGGNDTLTGGAGADEFFFDSVGPFGTDAITDFNAVEDTFQFNGTVALTSLTGGLDLDGNGSATDVRMITSLGTVQLLNIGASSAFLGGSGSDTLTATTSAFMVAGAGGDSVTGSAAADTLYGDAGDDFLVPGAGADVVWGGEGNDEVIYSAFSSQIIVDLNAFYASGAASGFDWVYQVENVRTGGGDDFIIGNGANNRIIGNNGGDYIEGRDGSDTLFGDGGQDTLVGGNGNDSIAGGTGIDFMYGGAGVDTVTFADLPAAVSFNAATGYAVSGSDFDFVLEFETHVFGAGNDSVVGWTGPVYLLGGGDDYFTDGASPLNGGGAINNIISGEAGIDYIFAGTGNDSIDGGTENDYILGGDGNDTLFGGAGVDYLNGGAGNDVFLFTNISQAAGALGEYIDGWNAGDRIDLATIDANTLIGGDQAFSIGALASGQAGRLQITPFTFDGINFVLVQGDVNGDGVADFGILAFNVTTLSAPDFVL